ncbi:MAG: hypothetical protein IJ905_17080 [Fibrobacter sp.]|nr:hypothetical protein [Fibrobacter sp.]MBR6124983.1 hypothetical protein [Candidatus Saccharibacteria bacterium]MBR6125949.1 hypothetical protein [Candidatus Saccharibacteria bacterium]
MAEKTWMVISIDSDSDSSTTEERRDILASHGFSELTPNKKVRLPESTYIGLIPDSEAGTTKVDEIWEDLESAGLEPRRIFGGTTDEWKVIRSRKDKD